MAPETESLRERKKRHTRESLATNARRLFRERGFDQVTVAEIAAASDVSVKTLFVYYASKEDLVFADEFSLLEQMLASLARRPAGVTAAATLRALARELISHPEDSDDGLAAFAALVGDTPSIHGRLLLMWERYEQRLAQHLAVEAAAANHAADAASVDPASVEAASADADTRTTAALLVAPFRVLTSPDVRNRVGPHAVSSWLDASFSRIERGVGVAARPHTT